MREIKFRAWNPSEDIMRYSQDFYNLRDFFGWVCLNDLQDKFTVMQYTGLKDSRNVEIYEGDIVRHYDERNEGTNLPTSLGQGVVKYEFNSFSFGVPCVPEHLEVIGNIYENPELLKE